MSITVADCLKLPSLREAQIVAGAGGIHRDVSCVSVLEHVDLLMLEREGFFLGNQIIISALVSIKDDVDAQCKLIHLLSDCGEVGLVLYYVGIFIKEIDQKVIDAANQLDFPLIMMPPNRYNHRYSDFISEAMQVIVDNQRQETNIVSGILDQIAHLRNHNRSYKTVLRLLSDRLRCSLLLADRKGNICAFETWPFGAAWDESDLNSILELWLKKEHFREPIEMHINGTDALVYCTALDISKPNDYFLAVIDEGNTFNISYLLQIEKTLHLVSTIWESTFAMEDTTALLESILSDSPSEMHRIAQALHIDITDFDTMWILHENKKDGDNHQSSIDWLAARLTSFLKGNQKTALVDVFEDYVMAFINSARNPFASFPQEFLKEVQSQRKCDLILFSSPWRVHESTEEVREAFQLMKDNKEAASILYPNQDTFTRHELRFVQNCRKIMEKGETELKNATKILTPLLQDEAGKDVLDTLTVFLLDCQGNVLETATRLYIHKNTVKYRLKKSERLLNMDLLKMPEIMDLYTALALIRMLS